MSGFREVTPGSLEAYERLQVDVKRLLAENAQLREALQNIVSEDAALTYHIARTALDFCSQAASASPKPSSAPA